MSVLFYYFECAAPRITVSEFLRQIVTGRLTLCIYLTCVAMFEHDCIYTRISKGINANG